MRKTFAALTAGVVGAMMIMSGCSGQKADTTTTAAESQVTTEAKSEESTENKEETSKTQESESESVAETAQEEAGIADMKAPVRIWGDVTEVTDRAIYVDNQSDNSSSGEIILTIDPETTRILDGATGFPVDLEDIEKGSFEAYLGPAMTMSLPPQSMPYVVIVNIPEDVKAPRYVVAAGSVEEKEGKKVLEGNDGTEYTLTEDVTVEPYLTKQIVRLEDIKEGSECLVWLDEEDMGIRLVLFNE